jgi:hypothetical protein
MSFLGGLDTTLGGGLLWKPIKRATGLSDAQMAGAALMAVAAPYALPAIGATGTAAGTAGAAQGATAAGSAGTAGAQGGLLSSFSQYAQPASQAMNIYGQARGLSEGPQVQSPQMQPMQSNPQAFAGLLSPSQQYDPLKRQQAQHMAVQGLLGGYRG